MYSIRLVCMSIFTVFCNAMDPVTHPTQAVENLMQALYSSIINYKYEETRDLITQYPSLVDTCNSYTYQNFSCENITPVHLAAWQGNSVALEQLCAVSKKSVNAVTKQGNTPLHLASNERVADLLLKNGAHPNTWNKHKCTPLYAALYGVCLYEHKPYFDVAHCLLKNGADINYECLYGETVLHKAISGNMNSELAQFLLNNRADGDIKDNTGETPFDQVIEQARQREVFQRFGYCYYWVQHKSSDPFELFKKDPEMFFLEKNTIWDILRDVYITAQKQEKNRQPMSNKSDAIIIRVCKKAKLYIFKRPSFADLEMYFGKQAIDSLRAYFENLYCKDMNGIKENARNPLYNIDDADNHGNSLLHTAVQYKKSEVIKFLIKDTAINCLLCNKEGKLAYDYLVDDACKGAFFDALMEKFFAKNLDQKHEEFVLNLLHSNHISGLGRLHYFLKTLRNYPEKSWFFLHRGIDVNGQHKGTSPLAYAVCPWLKISWRKIPEVHKYNIRGLLQCGAKVHRKLVEASHGYMKRLLQAAYDEQNQRLAEK